MNVLQETVISPPEAARIAHVTRAAVRDWILEGVSGIKLEGLYVGNRLKTSREALARFLGAVNARKLGG